MKNVNIGIANLIIANKLKESYFNDKFIVESTKITSDFFNVVKNSPVLQLEFKVFNNIENKHIENDQIATRYIDNNIKLFETYTIEEIELERAKLNPFITEGVVDVDNKKTQLYLAIDSLIKESLSFGENVDVDNIHESFTFVLNHIKTPKQSVISEIELEPINEDVIEIAIDKFNVKYESLNEDDKNLIKTIVRATDIEKQELLETYKTETLTILEGIDKTNTQDNITKAIQKIKEMVYNGRDVDDNIIKLYDLKKELI